MPLPASTTFERLRALAAIANPDERATAPILEIFSGEPLADIPMGTAADVAAALTKARAAQRQWASTTVAERARILERFRDLVLAERERLMDIVQAETGKARWSAQEEVLDVALNARYYARTGAGLLEPRGVQAALPWLTKTVVRHHPKGVVGVIAPWNYPMAMSISDALPALLAGNAVIVKPDARTPFSALANAELLYRAGIPVDLFAVVPGSGTEVGAAIAQSCDYLMFTGSTATGRVLAEQCGRRLIGISAELGGKNPMIVTDGANIAAVAKAAQRACFANSGQLCLSIERVYVERPVFEEFVAEFAAVTRAMNLGPGYGLDRDMGSLASADQLKAVGDHVEDAKAKGATVVVGGRPRPDLGPFFYEPTILTGVTEAMDCARTETFGPVVAVYPVADVEEAITRANDSEYGLNASVWAAGKAQGEAIAARLRAGSVNVDEGYGLTMASTAAPMGGMGISGLGYRHGSGGLLKYTDPQTVATASVLGLGAPFGVHERLWRAALTPMIQLIGRLPGR